MSKEITNDKEIVFKHYAQRNPAKLVLRKAQYEEALKRGTSYTKEFTEQLALINKTLGVSTEKTEVEEVPPVVGEKATAPVVKTTGK